MCLACRAPSLHNTQPWQWVLDGGQLQLFVDTHRVLAYDRSRRQALISCGAALDHFRVAMAAAGCGLMSTGSRTPTTRTTWRRFTSARWTM
ncbi:hypothetical protein I553_9446 [Mycobacterium xenopi 4042]|uniref:Nitroreductase family protein n=1 Tax=Mycobacterium xenopi 4042 TaxID=1299334 RepID=X8E0G8_MYCXE|nr:hypothetical protein I553_9446 [Mycobacterium xenopi 4042]